MLNWIAVMPLWVMLLLVTRVSQADDLFVVPDGVETRWASPENPGAERGKGATVNGGRKGAAFFPLKAGESRVLAEVKGSSGVVRRIWMTLNDRSPRLLRGMRLDIYWDGAKTPAVSAPLGDFFGVGLGRLVPFQSVFFSSPEGRSFNASIPMPFRQGMRMVLTNESGQDQPQVYYDVDFTLGDRLPADALFFHAAFRRENPTKMQRDYEILPRVSGKGRYLGANIGVIVDGQRYGATWWGEGEVKIYLDGDTALPTLAGTGAEDYIGTGYGLGTYSHLYQGAPLADHEHQRYAFYRYHVNDPVYFRREARVTIQQIGFVWSNDGKPEKPLTPPIYKAGEGLAPMDLEHLPQVNLFERADDYSSCVYFYLDRADRVLPALIAADERMQGL
jgi:D-arabinan exo alpha-(1,3)/(1,5)-arabinofuranosidase (non-reducing end)